MQIIEVTDKDFKEQVLENPLPVVVDFWAPWCAPCKALAVHLKNLAEEYGDEIVIAKINVDQNRQTAMHYEVKGIPAIRAFYRGQIVNEINGMSTTIAAQLRLLADGVIEYASS